MNNNAIKKNTWYRQETEGTPYFIYQPCRGCLSYFRDQEKIFWYSTLDSSRAYLDKEKLRSLAEKYLDQEKKNPGTFLKMFNHWNKVVRDKNEKIFLEIEKYDLKKINNKKLLAINKKLARQSFFMWTQFFVDTYDLDAESLVKREVVKDGVKLTENDINILMSQEMPLIHQRSERDLLKIVKLVKKDSNAVNIFSYISAPENLHRLNFLTKIKKEIDEYQKKYFWIYNSWAYCRYLSQFEIVDNIKQILNGPRMIEKELDNLNNFSKNIKKSKDVILKKCKASRWLRQMFNFFGILSFWRDERKMQMQRMNYYLEQLGVEIARRSKMGWDYLKQCDPLVINSLPVTKKLVDKNIKLLKNQPVMQWQKNRIVHLPKTESKKIEREIEKSINLAVSEIRGMIACPGKVEGEIVVINKMSEFGKMEVGKILVTVMTRPEFVPLMKKAAGIITDEGGVTSHAAVISRELRVPCVIGTQVATKKLKDGDKVFLNADHGIVILK